MAPRTGARGKNITNPPRPLRPVTGTPDDIPRSATPWRENAGLIGGSRTPSTGQIQRETPVEPIAEGDEQAQEEQLAHRQQLVDAYEALCEARGGYERAEAFFEGECDEFFSTEKVQQLLAKAGVHDLDQISYAHIPVTTVAGRLKVQSITATSIAAEQAEEDSEEEDTLTRQANEVINKLIDENQLLIEIPGLFTKTCEFGDWYMFIWPVTEETAEADDSNPATDTTDVQWYTGGPPVGVEMFLHSAKTVRVFYSDENPLRKSHAIRAWEFEDLSEQGKKTCYRRANMWFPDRLERWITNPDQDGTKPEHWVPFTGDEKPAVLPNVTGRIPFIHFRTDRPYGTPLHKKAYGPQQLIDKLVRAHAAMIDYQTFPQRYGLVDPAQDQVLGNYVDPQNPEDEDDDPEGNANTSPLRADPSAFWRMRGYQTVGQFDPADPNGLMGPFDRYVQAMAEVTETPLYRFGSKFAQTPSGQALREADAPTNNKTEVLQPQLGGNLADGFEFALELMGITGVRVAVDWKPTYRVNDTEGWSTLSAKGQNGVPVRQRLLEAGYTNDQIDDWLPDEAQQDLLAQVNLLNEIGTAVQTLGAGVGLGVLSQQQANQVVMRVLGLLDAQGGVDESQIEDWYPGEGKDELVDPKPPAPEMVPGQQPPPGGVQPANGRQPRQLTTSATQR